MEEAGLGEIQNWDSARLPGKVDKKNEYLGPGRP